MLQVQMFMLHINKNEARRYLNLSLSKTNEESPLRVSKAIKSQVCSSQ